MNNQVLSSMKALKTGGRAKSTLNKIRELIHKYHQAESNSEKKRLVKMIGELQQLKLF